MRCRLAIAVVLFASTLAGAGVFPGTQEDTVHIPQLVGKSSLVCKGEVTAAPSVKTIDGPLPRFTGVASVRVDRCFKGEPSGGELLVAADEYRPAGGWAGGGRLFTPVVGEYLLLFLKPHGGTYELADQNAGALPVSKKISTFATGGPLLRLEADFEAGLKDSDPEMRLRSICWLGRMRHLRSTAALHKLIPHADRLTRAFVWESLLLVGETSVIEEVAKVLQKNPPTRHDFSLPRDRLELMQLRLYRAFCGMRDPAVVPYLEHFAGSPNARIRVEAIQALRAIGSLSSASVFLRALDDPREYIDFTAMQSLFELAGEGPSDFGPAYAEAEEGRAYPRVHAEQCRRWWKNIGEPLARTRLSAR